MSLAEWIMFGLPSSPVVLLAAIFNSSNWTVLGGTQNDIGSFNLFQ
jgi:hypothetical protein